MTFSDIDVFRSRSKDGQDRPRGSKRQTQDAPRVPATRVSQAMAAWWNVGRVSAGCRCLVPPNRFRAPCLVPLQSVSSSLSANIEAHESVLRVRQVQAPIVALPFDESNPNVAVALANPLRYFLVIILGVFLKGGGIDILWPDMGALGLSAAVILSISVMRLGEAIG